MGMSGSGKTFSLGNHPLINKKSARVVVWDTEETHKAFFFRDMLSFKKAAAKVATKKTAFKIGLSVNPTPANFEEFCKTCWLMADGKKELIIIVGELADVARTGKATENWGRLVRVGRKYGVVLLVESQRPAEIDKTIFTQAGSKWVGYLEDYDHKYVERNLGLPANSMRRIKFESYDCFFKGGGKLGFIKKDKKIPFLK